MVLSNTPSLSSTRCESRSADSSELIEAGFARLGDLSVQLLAEAGRGDLSAIAAASEQIRSIQEELAEAYLARGISLSGQGNDERAISDFSHALRLVPKHSRLLVARGEALRRRGEFVDALVDLDAAIQLDPELIDAWCGRGEVHLACGQIGTAIVDFGEALQLDPKRADAFLGRGRSRLVAGNAKAACDDLDQAIRLNPEFPPAYYHRGCCFTVLGNHSAALIDFDRTLTLDPQYGTAYLARGRTRRFLGDLSGAVADLDESLRQFPESVPTLTERGQVYRDQGDYARAVMDFSESLRLAPDSVTGYLNRALSLCLMGDPARTASDIAEAIHRSSQVVESAPPVTEMASRVALGDLKHTKPHAMASNGKLATNDLFRPERGVRKSTPPRVTPAAVEFARGEEFYEASRFDNALAAYDEAIRLDPEFAGAYRERGHIHLLLKKYEAADEDLTRAIEGNPQDAAAYLLKGNLHTEAGDLDAAILNFDAAIDVDPQLAVAYSNRGLAHAQLGKFAEALTDAVTAVRLDHEHGPGYFVRGVASAALGRGDEAIADFSRVLQIDPEDTLTYNERGLVYHNRDEFSRAIADYTAALRINPAFQLARLNRAIALRSSGAFPAALSDFDEILRRQPQLARGYYQRGLVYTALEDHDRALADMDGAIQLDPDLRAAHAMRAKLLRSRPTLATPTPQVATPDQNLTRSIPSKRVDPEHVRSVADDAVVPLGTTELLTSGASASAAAVLARGPASAARLGPVAGSSLELVCPNCGSTGRVAWKNLGKQFRCEMCSTAYRTDGTGKLTRLVDAVPNSPTVRDRSRPVRPQKRIRHRFRFGRIGAGVLTAVFLVIAVAATVTLREVSAHPAESRGAELTRAWLAQDKERMREWTDPDAEKHLEKWLTQNPPPEAVRAGNGPAPDIRVSIGRTDGKAADLAIRLVTKDAEGASMEFVVYQHWVEKSGRWYFVPDSKNSAKKPPKKKA